MRIASIPLIFIILIFSACTNGNESENKADYTAKDKTPKAIGTGTPTVNKPDKNTVQNLPLSYSVLRTRNIRHDLKNDSIEGQIDQWIHQHPNPSIDEMIDFSLETTSKYLDFTFKNTSTDLDVLLESGKANCVGYAIVFNSILNSLLNKTKNGTYPAFITEQCVGQISVNEVNIHEMFTDPFFKDHDFIVIDYLKSNEQIAVDPSLYEYFGIKRVTLK